MGSLKRQVFATQSTHFSINAYACSKDEIPSGYQSRSVGTAQLLEGLCRLLLLKPGQTWWGVKNARFSGLTKNFKMAVGHCGGVRSHAGK